MKNTKGLTDYNYQKAERCRQHVIAAIEQCKADDNITITRVCKIAGINRSYFSKHPEMRKALDDAIGIVNRKTKKSKQSSDSHAVIEKSLYIENTSLKKQVEALEKYKKQYESKCDEVERLKKALDIANLENGILDF